MRVPKLRSELKRKASISSIEGEEIRHASWLELFYDLAFVATIGQLGYNLSKNFDLAGLGMFFLAFISIWWCWVGQTVYLSRFDTGDLFHRGLALFQVFVMVCMAVFIPSFFKGDIQGFAIGYGLIRLSIVLGYFSAGQRIPIARPMSNFLSLGFGVAAFCWILAGFFPSPVSISLACLGLLLDVVVPFSRPKLAATIPPHFEHLPERFGLFTIIVLGEGIIATEAGLDLKSFHFYSGVAALMGLAIICCLWWIYFEGVRGAHIAVAKTTREFQRLQAWLMLHLPVTISIVLVAVGFKKILALEEGKVLPLLSLQTFGVANVVLMVSLHGLWYLGIDRSLRKRAHALGLPHAIATGVGILATLFLGQLSVYVLVGIYFLVYLAHTFLNTIERPELRELLEQNEAIEKKNVWTF